MSDLIDRQAAIATAISGRIRTLPTTEDGENWIRVNEVRDSLLSLPTAQPKRGKWIDETFKQWGLVHHPFKCNLCGEHAEFASPYCPNCGADMRGEEEWTK